MAARFTIMGEPLSTRTNQEWVEHLSSDGPEQDQAIQDLRTRLQRSLYHYLRTDRSDLRDRNNDQIEQMAQDFAQDAILKVLDNLHTFRGESKFTTWATKITTRVAISELRRARYKDYSLEHITIGGETLPDITSLSISPSTGPSPERYTEQQDILRKIDRAIDGVLTERQRTALIAATIDGVPIEEIAARMNTNRNALYKLIHDARVKLKKHLENEGISMDYVMKAFER